MREMMAETAPMLRTLSLLRTPLAPFQELREVLGLGDADVSYIRYQLLHRAAAALRMAEKFGASVAVLLVQGFGAERDEQSRADFARFHEVMACSSASEGLTRANRGTCVPLLVGWLTCTSANDAMLRDAV